MEDFVFYSLFNKNGTKTLILNKKDEDKIISQYPELITAKVAFADKNPILYQIRTSLSGEDCTDVWYIYSNSLESAYKEANYLYGNPHTSIIHEVREVNYQGLKSLALDCNFNVLSI